MVVAISFILFILGVHFKKQEKEVLQDFVTMALRVFFHAVDAMLHEQSTYQDAANSSSHG